VQKALRPALFSGLLLLAAYLRITGLSWGLSSGYGHELNFQPDEFVSLRGVLELDLLAGRIKAPDAYFAPLIITFGRCHKQYLRYRVRKTVTLPTR
jgi:hypothetical protein